MRRFLRVVLLRCLREVEGARDDHGLVDNNDLEVLNSEQGYLKRTSDDFRRVSFSVCGFSNDNGWVGPALRRGVSQYFVGATPCGKSPRN
jgi:hypothetical protein